MEVVQIYEIMLQHTECDRLIT